MSAQYTPGPWAYELDEKDGQFQYAIYAEDASPGGKLLALADTEANARLIVAAPDLLMTLQSARRYLVENYQSPLAIPFTNLLTTVRAAIEKATP